MIRYLPASVSALVAGGYVLWRLSIGGGDPIALFELGDGFEGGVPLGTEGYDGQFSYWIAVDPAPSRIETRLDVPAYRYQRILYPLLGRVLALGQARWIPWSLIGVGLASLWGGTYAAARFLERHNLSPWYALSYGLWVGLVAPVGIGLGEPLAYGLVAVGMLALSSERNLLAGLLLGLAAFAKETTLPFLAAAVLAELLNDRDRKAIAAFLVSTAGFVAWQVWLTAQFGSPGIASGGAMASAFEWIPYLGLLRIGSVSLAALGLYLLIFGPSVVLPSLWGAIRSLSELRQGPRDVYLFALLFNSLLVMALPFSTFREPLGLVRLVDGLVLAVLLFAGSRRLHRPLRYSLFWSGLLAMLIAQ